MIKEIDSELEEIDKLIDSSVISKIMRRIKSDYKNLSLLKMLVLQTWHNMSMSKSVKRDIVFMRFCGFSIDGKKPNEATLCRFIKKLIENKLWDKILKKNKRGVREENENSIYEKHEILCLVWYIPIYTKNALPHVKIHTKA